MSQRLQNNLIALMFLCWAILRVTQSNPVDRWTIPQVTPALMHLTAAGLFLFRQPWQFEGNVTSVALSLPSFVAGGLAISMAPPPHAWSPISQLIFATGAAGAVGGMLVLGKSFAIFPAVREIVRGGPFRLIRHPIYFCELFMIAGCCVAGEPLIGGGLFTAAIATVILRIVCEETILLRSNDYVALCHSVRYRLIPGIW